MNARPFIHEHFLLETPIAIELYERFARDLPIIDYHSHLPPADVARDRTFGTMTRLWLEGDHYKWRAMRSNGVNERFCTGDASDWEKFEAWAATVPKTLRNPLYHWTHLELKNPFGLDGVLLNKETAPKVWEHCNACLQKPEFTARGLLRHFKVEVICTTDDPTDTLEHHKAVAADPSFSAIMVPAFRPDKAHRIDDPVFFRGWVERLASSAEMTIVSYMDFLDALRKRHAVFHDLGCRVSDHGLETIAAEQVSAADIAAIFRRAMDGQHIGPDDTRKFGSALLFEFGLMDYERGWTQQYHLGALRNTNPRMFHSLGPDTGFDTIGDFEIARPLARLLGKLDDANALPKTILYNLNPRDNDLMASMLGNFQDGTVPGKMQYGSAWWFLDQKEGIERQLNALSNLGLLSRFVGMLTDSRSFLSFPRHDYFRRVLCNLLGDEMERGLLPNDVSLVGPMVSDICYYNAKSYFGFQFKPHKEKAS
jgi:glucuronate isomerase